MPALETKRYSQLDSLNYGSLSIYTYGGMDEEIPFLVNRRFLVVSRKRLSYISSGTGNRTVVGRKRYWICHE